jgi:predicted ATPase
LARKDEVLRQESQFIIATHSPIQMAYPEAAICQIGSESIRKMAYRETEHYQRTKMFQEKHEQVLNKQFSVN